MRQEVQIQLTTSKKTNRLPSYNLKELDPITISTSLEVNLGQHIASNTWISAVKDTSPLDFLCTQNSVFGGHQIFDNLLHIKREATQTTCKLVALRMLLVGPWNP
jgi:hypothetical protein